MIIHLSEMCLVRRDVCTSKNSVGLRNNVFFVSKEQPEFFFKRNFTVFEKKIRQKTLLGPDMCNGLRKYKERLL